jgi:hypothetical protein
LPWMSLSCFYELYKELNNNRKCSFATQENIFFYDETKQNKMQRNYRRTREWRTENEWSIAWRWNVLRKVDVDFLCPNGIVRISVFGSRLTF